MLATRLFPHSVARSAPVVVVCAWVWGGAELGARTLVAAVAYVVMTQLGAWAAEARLQRYRRGDDAALVGSPLRQPLVLGVTLLCAWTLGPAATALGASVIALGAAVFAVVTAMHGAPVSALESVR